MFAKFGTKLVNLSQIRQMTMRYGRTDAVVSVEFSDESVREYEVKQDFDLSTFTRNFIPAPPGYVLLRYLPKDKDAEELVIRTPIVAFKYESDSGPLVPVTFDGRQEAGFHDFIGVLYPDGQVCIPDNRDCDSIEDFLDYCRQSSIAKVA